MPLDYRDPAAGHIKLGFQWYPATKGKAKGTILAVQGGPGYPTTDYAADYRGMFLPLLGRRNLLLVNLRGTGNSSAFLCKPLQRWKPSDGNAAYTIDTGKCGRTLNHTRKLPGGGYVRASDLYTTANAARDVALLLRRLRTGKVDFYGDSYGTFVGQTLTARYATMLRSVTLDAAYPVSGKDPFYPHMIQTARRAFDISCFRSVACHRAAPGSAWARLSVLAAYLRHHPVTGRTRDPFGRKVTERVTTIKLSEMVNDAGSDNGVYRELDAAGRALLDDHDPQPLLRLTEQDIYTGDSGPVREFNAGLYQATTCLDYPQPFSYSQTPAERAAQYARAVAALPAGMFSPFTVHEWVTEPEEEFDTCLDWPAPARPGDQAGRTGLRLAAVGAAAVGDAVWRWYYGDGVKGWGLRGGTFKFTGDGSRIGHPAYPGALDVGHQGQRDRPVEPGQRENPGTADRCRAGGDLRRGPAPVLRLRPALGSQPVRPLPGGTDRRHDAGPLTADWAGTAGLSPPRGRFGM